MKDFFKTNEIKIVLDNHISFKHKLNLSQDDYDYLNNTKNLHEFTEALIAGAIGLISNPIGWMALAAGGAGAAVYGARQLSKQADEKAYD